MTSHANCTHPATKAGRAACRRIRNSVPASERNRLDMALDEIGRKRRADAKKAARAAAKASWTDPNAVGAIDEATLDDRIRASKVKPSASPVKVSKVDPDTLR